MRTTLLLAMIGTVLGGACGGSNGPLPAPRHKTWRDGTCSPPEPGSHILLPTPCSHQVDACARGYRYSVEVAADGAVRRAYLYIDGVRVADCTTDFHGRRFEPARSCGGDPVPGVFEEITPPMPCIYE